MHPHDQADLLLRILDAPRRNRFFYGKRMDVEQFQMEQDYGKRKQWLLNRLTLGKGVLCGLAVSADGNRVCVDPGVAIDGLGREIVVPVRTCLDPSAEPGCCGGGHAGTTGPGQTATAPRDDAQADDAERLGRIFTVWLCYRECLADPQPVLVTDCDTHAHCAQGTVVETFCLKITPGLPPRQHDPEWCLNWARGADASHEQGGDKPPTLEYDKAAVLDAVKSKLAVAGKTPVDADIEHLPKTGRRRDLCELLDGACDPDDGDPCVPLAVGLLRDGKIVKLDSCRVRPRVYSNAVLLDLILCLAARVDECCKGHEEPPPPKPLLRVEHVAFLSIDRAGQETVVAEVASPLDSLKVPIAQRPNAIRVRFTAPFAQDVHLPTTHAFNDPDFKRHNVQVLPAGPLNNLDYVPGTLKIEDARTIRFDLFPDSPYVRSGQGAIGWQKGRYMLSLYGDDDAGANRRGIADTGGRGLDGEPAAPAGGVISGNGTPGGTFTLEFVIG